jgi:hypothetical protein
MAYNRWDILRGAQFEVSDQAEAERLVAVVHADFGKVPLHKLGRAGEPPTDTKLLERVSQRILDGIPPESRPNPHHQPVIGGRQRPIAADGWLGP